MTKAMFPNKDTEEDTEGLWYEVSTTLDGDTVFTYDWWSSPYKAEGEEEE